MKHGESPGGFEDYVNMDHMDAPQSVATRRSTRNSQIDEPMPFQDAGAVRMRNNNVEDEQIYEICYDYKARRGDELDLRRGSVVRVVKDAEKGWVHGVVDGKDGLFPKNYLRAIGPCNFRKIRTDEIAIESLIGEGAAGEVFRATYKRQSVAFKKFKLLGREGEEDVLEKTIYNVKREAAHFSNLRHENIVKLYGVCLDVPTIGLVIELCEGGTLSQVYRKVADAAVPKRILVDWSLQICAAMEAISTKFVHRDLKMDNVLVLQKVCLCALPSGKFTPDRTNFDLYMHENIQANGVCSECGGTAFDRLKLKLTDFGLTRENSVPSHQSVAAGTSAWIAPEAYQKNEYSEFSDVWSFGVVFWELITRKQPYDNLPSVMIPFYVATGLVHLKISKEFPPAVNHIITQCLQMEPEKRPRFREIRNMLEKYMEDLLRVNDQVDYIEQRRLEDELVNDINQLKSTGDFDEQLKKFEEELRRYQAKAPEPAERTAGQKKIDKSLIGVPTEPRLLIHLSHGGTLPRNLDLLDSRVSSDLGHAPLKATLSKSQPNLNQLHVSPQSKISRDRHYGIRKKKERTNDEITGIDEYLRESSSTYDDGESVSGVPFSLSHGDSPQITTSATSPSSFTANMGTNDKRGSIGSVSGKGGGRSSKDGGHSRLDKIFSKIFGKREGRSPAPRHSSVSIDSDDLPSSASGGTIDNPVVPGRSQSISSASTTSTLLYNASRMPMDPAFMCGGGGDTSSRRPGKSPDSRAARETDDRRRRNITATQNTKTYTKGSSSSGSSLTHPSSVPPMTPSSSSSLNTPYSTLSNSQHRPSGLSGQQPFQPGSSSSYSTITASAATPSSSSSASNTPVGLDEQYPPNGGYMDGAYLHLRSPPHSSSNASSSSLSGGSSTVPPELPPRRRQTDDGNKHNNLTSCLSSVIPLDQSSPTSVDAAMINGYRHRSRTVSSCAIDSPLECHAASSSPYIEMPSNAAVVVTNGGYMRGIRRDSSPDFIVNPSYEPYRSMVRRLDDKQVLTPPPLEAPPLPPPIPPRIVAPPSSATMEYLTLSTK